MSLVNIAGYVTRKDAEFSEMEMLDITTCYQERFGMFTDNIDCGQLNIPSDFASQWNV